VLKIFIPRFSQGEGSIIRVDALFKDEVSISEDFSTYVTYDDGSIKSPALIKGWYQDPRLLPISLLILAALSIILPYINMWRISIRRNFATRVLFDFVHIHYRLERAKVSDFIDQQPIVKDDMKGYALWNKYRLKKKQKFLKIDSKFFSLIEGFDGLKGKNPEDSEYEYYDAISKGYDLITDRDLYLNKNKNSISDAKTLTELKSKNDTLRIKSGEIVTAIRWDVYHI
jgi:hypothetical protein